MNRDLFLAILAMDSYNRGYGAAISGLQISGISGDGFPGTVYLFQVLAQISLTHPSVIPGIIPGTVYEFPNSQTTIRYTVPGIALSPKSGDSILIRRRWANGRGRSLRHQSVRKRAQSESLRERRRWRRRSPPY